MKRYGWGARRQPEDARDHRLVARGRRGDVRTVSYRHPHARRDQGAEGCCVGFSSSFAKQWYDFRQGRAYTLYSPRDLYAACKAVDGDPHLEGTYTRVAMKVLQKRGIALEDAWPYVPYQGNVPPSDLSAGARPQRIAQYAAIKDANDLIQVLLHHGPVVACVPITTGWFTEVAEATGVIDTSYKDDQGGHAVEVLGYDAELGYFEAGGSWGSDYGDAGHHWFPHDWFARHFWGAWTLYDDERIDEHLELVTP